MSLMRTDARPEALPIDKLQLDGLVQERLAMLSGIARSRGVDLEFDEPATAAWIVAEREGLVSLADNLIENAIKYSPPGSTVTVGVDVRPDSVEFSVADSGPGILTSCASACSIGCIGAGPDSERQRPGPGHRA